MKANVEQSESAQSGLPQSERWSYTPQPSFWDEAVVPSGMPRRHWRKLAVAIGRMGPGQFKRRWQAGQHLIQSHGITYNVYGDAQGMERPWSLDPVPLVLGRNEWAGLESAVIQRASLLNLILSDLYGEQKLIHQRRFPAALLYSNPNFLRPCMGIKPPGGAFLHNYAVDIARSPDGRWWVISDRTQAPSGVGYTLENRLVSARTLPSAFDQCHVRPLNRFLDQTRDTLLALAPNRRNYPRVVVLTPGPNNETYFEQSFLARHWGFPLVEGADLTVRDNRVFLKTLAGLEPVDLVLRRLDDIYCDPLELRGDSLLGIPGFTNAVRGGHVAVANALGSGLLETSAHMAFLPGLCRHLLGEELRLPSVATWWCGEEGPRGYVADYLINPQNVAGGALVIKPAFPRPGQNPEFPSTMDAAARQKLAARILADPEMFVAQEQVKLSTAPVRTEDGFTPRHVVLRMFAAWDGHSYTVMPGGLTRVSVEADSPVVSMQMGGGSKDTWVLSDAGEDALAVAAFTRKPISAPAPIELPSRVADNLFWLGRYAERVESAVRMVRALLPGLSGEQDFGQTATVESAIQLLAGLGYLPDDFSSASLAQQRWQVGQVLSGLVYDPSRSSSIGWSLRNMRRVAWPLKERLSTDTWRVLQQLEMEFSAAAPVHPELRLVAQMSLLDRIVVILSAFSGLLMENTTRTPGWRFLEIGRRMERAWQMSDLLLAALVQGPFDIEPAATTLLQIADSSITYRGRYFTEFKTEHVLEILLADQANPRAIGFQLATLRGHLQDLPGYRHEGVQGIEAPLPLTLAQRMLSSLQLASIEELSGLDAEGNLAELEQFLRRLQGSLYDLSELLTAHHFNHLVVSRMPSSI